ncbi:MAG: DNA mismatch repair endonuclease MutL [Clostridiales bacterium]|nr:DNA mismatch repair endonuclease MutL [Clostridiales bacterium]
MGNIVLLDDLTINKIAAGEVIERPASVVKELVENSIDAGADNISIEIKSGGISYIRITDNGKGFQPDDLEIAFERHATSKIRNAEDLETVKSMGFRGEALASIAAIARVELISKTENSDVGYRVLVEGGKILLKEEVGCPKGTTITIENLFYNTPVRYKFLKKDFTESGYIEDVVTRIALVNPNVSFKFINAGKTIIQTSGNGNIKDIVYGIYGKDIAENIINVEYYFEDMAVKGVIGKPNIARSNRTNQLFFVNKRYVKDKTLTSAAEQGFKGMLTVGKYGFLILNVEIDSQKLDVNVHPAKLEVRFQEENKVFKLVYHAIKESLLKGNILGQESTDVEQKLKMDYINDVEKTSNISNSLYSENNENDNKSKGFGNFFKNIMNGSKNEFMPNSENVVEQVYNDKIKGGYENNTVPVIENDKEQEFSNMIVKGDGSIELKGTEELKKDEFKQNTNLQRLMKELDANLEKMNMKNFSIEKSENEVNDVEDVNRIENNNDTIVIEENSASNVIGNNIKDGNEINDVNKEEIVENKLENKQENELESKSEDGLENKLDSNQSEELKSDSNFEKMYEKMFGTNLKKNKVEEQNEGYVVKQEEMKTVENVSIFNNRGIFNKPVYKYIGIAFDTYIIIEYEKEMYIIDQHAAHERILYEKVKKNYYSDTDKDSQLMLLPDIINLTHREMGIAKDNMQLFRKAGFDLEEFGENTIKLNGVPNICIDLDTKELFLETLDEINTVARTAKQEIEEKFIATVACKAAVKANMALNVQEVDNLMQQLLVLPNPFTCPHGRPTAIKMSKIDIEKKFSRR